MRSLMVTALAAVPILAAPDAAAQGGTQGAPAQAAQPVRLQPADSVFDSVVARPAYPRGRGPRVAIDAGHGNFHTAAGRYRPFATVLAGDGYRVTSYEAAFTRAGLAEVDVLVIANALGPANPGGPPRPALTEAESDAVVEWVRGGGALLLVADHEPMAPAVEPLARRLGVEMRGGRTYDDPHSDWTSGSPSWLVFSADTGARVADHPITRGRDSTERVRRVVTFTGQSLAGPPGGTPLLVLAEGARDRLPDGRDLPAGGRSQLVAFPLGRGRVVVAGEAAMFTAQVASAPNVGERRFGFTWPNTDDRQLALNVVRWLGRAIE